MPKRKKREPLKLGLDGEICVGVDETGRGPIFSRVYTAAVILPKNFVVPDDIVIVDSKLMTENQLQKSSKYIREHALDWVIGWRDEKDIDRIGNLDTTIEECWHGCIDKLTEKFTYILVDGIHFKKYKNIPHQCVVKGDNKYQEIACSSIIAKVERDRYIRELTAEYPDLESKYKIHSNVGYPTPFHKQAILQHGITQFHRKSCKPCKNMPLNPVVKSAE